jgi:hypothetical protein
LVAIGDDDKATDAVAKSAATRHFPPVDAEQKLKEMDRQDITEEAVKRSLGVSSRFGRRRA